MKKKMNTARVAMGRPASKPALIVYAQRIVEAMQGNPSFPAP